MLEIIGIKIREFAETEIKVRVRLKINVVVKYIKK